MMKASAKRRRSKAQVLEDKGAALKKEQELQQKLAQWAQMEAANREMSEKLGKAAIMYDQVTGMFDAGLMATDANGAYRVVQDPAESE